MGKNKSETAEVQLCQGMKWGLCEKGYIWIFEYFFCYKNAVSMSVKHLCKYFHHFKNTQEISINYFLWREKNTNTFFFGKNKHFLIPDCCCSAASGRWKFDRWLGKCSYPWCTRCGWRLRSDNEQIRSS